MLDLNLDQETIESFKSSNSIFKLMGISSNFIYSSLDNLLLIGAIFSLFLICLLIYFIKRFFVGKEKTDLTLVRDALEISWG
jgi:hypothetical protein